MNPQDIEGLKAIFNRNPESHKYDYGHVLVVGGSPGMVGAPLLAAMAALRSGAGLVTIASTPDVIDKLERRIKEVMALRLFDVKSVLDFISQRKVKVAAIGPGLNSNQSDLVRELLPHLKLPVVLDAGGLVAFDSNLSLLKEAAKNNPAIVLTPHEGELAKLLGHGVPEAKPEREALVKATAKDLGVALVLKGHHSLVAGLEGKFYVNGTGNPGLATAGTGDVLTGVIAGLLTQDLPAFEAAKYGVYLHGLAGDLASAEKSEPGMIASDVIEQIPTVVRNITSSQ